MRFCIEHIDELCAAIVGASATLMSVCVGVVAVVPAMLELLRARNADYFENREMRKILARYLRLIAHTIWIFVVAQLIAGAGIIWPEAWLLVAASCAWGGGLAFLLFGGFQLARMALASL